MKGTLEEETRGHGRYQQKFSKQVVKHVLIIMFFGKVDIIGVTSKEDLNKMIGMY